MPITATRALYIKLGEGNRWVQLAFDSSTLRFGFRDIPHDQALAAVEARDFTSVKSFYENERSVAAGTATRYSNEVREFYTAAQRGPPEALYRRATMRPHRPSPSKICDLSILQYP